jgi:hypothetical protein
VAASAATTRSSTSAWRCSRPASIPSCSFPATTTGPTATGAATAPTTRSNGWAGCAKLFFAKPRQTLGRYPLAVETQADDPAFSGWPEHQRWQIGPLLFLTLNVPGSNNNFGKGRTPGEEFVQRSAAVKAWIAAAFTRARALRLEGIVIIMQANPDIEDFSAGRPRRGYYELLTQLLAETKRFDGQVLLVHGDSHVHRVDTPLREPSSGQRVANFTRLETWGSPFMGWVKVEVTPGEKTLFRFGPKDYSPRPGD